MDIDWAVNATMGLWLMIRRLAVLAGFLLPNLWLIVGLYSIGWYLCIASSFCLGSIERLMVITWMDYKELPTLQLLFCLNS